MSGRPPYYGPGVCPACGCEEVNRVCECTASRSEKMRDAGFTPRDTRLTCDECGAKFTRQFAPLHECEAPAVSEPMSKWPFEQPHVARDLLARLYATMGEPRDAKLEAEIDVFLAATRRSGAAPEESDLNSGDLIAAMLRDGAGS